MLNFQWYGLLAVSLRYISTGVVAEQGAWAQCGGIGWSGATECTAGFACTYVHDDYRQCIAGTAKSSAPASARSSDNSPNYWFSFGDSYTQTGFVPVGFLPAPGNPLGNPPYPGWTAGGGSNWIDVETTVFNHSLVLTYNYAFGGATIDSNLVAPYLPIVLSLTDQVNEFLDTAGSKPAWTPWTSSNAIFSIWIGINDIGNSYTESGDRAAFSDTLLDAEFSLVQKLYDAGARNFLWINVPPVDRSPLTIANGASDAALEKTVIDGFNAKLAPKIKAFAANYTDAKTWLYDSHAEFTKILDSPTTYGFADATSYGGENDFWANTLHPTSAVHTIIGKQIGELLGGTVW
ncbi:carbohydrate esterase family 16 protein [Plicaturopsis crispa FD-325 SS-3]|nr:carbohydrate esterase family 16 protein [Plicaturopsis crispa FD-325 SS-3]